MRYAGVVLMVVAMAPFSFGRAEDAPAREPDAVLRDVLRKAVAEVYADLDQNTFDWASTLAYSILEIDDKEQARVILLHNLENLEKNYQSREARVVGLREQPSFLHQDLMYRARLLNRAGFGTDGHALLRRLAQMATSTVRPQEEVLLSIIENQIRVGDLEGARSTRDRAVRITKDLIAELREDLRKKIEDGDEDNPEEIDDLTIWLNWAERFPCCLHLAAHEPAKSLDLFQQQIEAAEKLKGNATSSRSATRKAWKHCHTMGKHITEELADAFSEEDRNPPSIEASANLARLRTLLKRSRELIMSHSKEQEPYLIPLLATMGDDAGAVRILESLRNRPKTQRPRENDPENEEIQQWLDRSTRHSNWDGQLSGWTAVCKARKARRNQAAALDALKEVEALLRNPVPEPGPEPSDKGDHQETDRVRRAQRDQPTPPEPNIDWDMLSERYKATAELMAELGEFDRAVALVKHLPPAFQVVAIWPALDWLEEAGKKDLVNDLLRQNLEIQLQAFQELEARPIQEATPAQSKLRPAEIDLFQPKPPNAQEKRTQDRSISLSRIANIQARLGQFEAAKITALQMPLEDPRIEVQGSIYLYMARSGKTLEAFEQALTLDHPEPRSTTLIKVAKSCISGLRLNQRDKAGKDDNEDQNNP